MAVESAKHILRFFRETDCPFYCRFSGMGFHFVVPYELIKITLPDHSFYTSREDNIYKIYRSIALFLRDNFSEMVDTVIYDKRRIIKIPYSLALYDHSVVMCCPLFSPERELRDFNRDEFGLDRVDPENLYLGPEVLQNPKGTGYRFFQKTGVLPSA